MKIGIIGSGNVGGTLGSRLAAAGHTVTFSSRNPDSPAMRELLAKAGPTARAATVADAVADSDVILLATPWPGTRDALESAGSLAGKIVIDATNPLNADLSALEAANTTSGAEQVAAWAPGAKIVKAFNTVGFKVMANPAFAEGPACLFYCGDDKAAKAVAAQLAAELGFDPRDAGSLTRARVLEPFALLWISLAVFEGYGMDFAFRLMKK